MQYLFRKNVIATTVFSLCSVASVYAADNLDKAQLVEAAKQIAQSTEFDKFEASLESETTSEAKRTKTETFKVEPTADIAKHQRKHKPMGVLQTEQSIRKRLAQHGKQRLVIHDQGQKLRLSIEALTKVLDTPSVNFEVEPTSTKDELTKPTNADMGVSPSLKEAKLKNIEHLSRPNKLKESVSQIKSLFAAKVQTDNSKQKTSTNQSAAKN